MKWLDMPPVWVAGFAAVAYVQAHYFSAGLSLAHPVTMLIAGVLVGGGIVIAMLAALEFRKHRTTLPCGVDYVVIPRQGIRPDWSRIHASFPRLAERVHRKLLRDVERTP